MRKYAFGLLVLLVFDAHAALFCVSSGNALGIAITTSQSNGQDDEIRVTMGTHSSDQKGPQTPQFSVNITNAEDVDKDLIISGGWSTGNNCATQISLNPSATVLDALQVGPVFFVQIGVGSFDSFSGTIALRNLTLNRGKGFSDLQVTGIEVYGSLASPGSVLLENLHVVNGISAANSNNAFKTNLSGSGSVRIRNNIVSLNNLTGSGSEPVYIRQTGNVIGYISNNSIFANSGTAIASGLALAGSVATLSNNAVADNISTANVSYQFFSNTASGLTLIKNHFGTWGYNQTNGTPFSSTGITTGSPEWTANGVVRIPNNVSPLRDSGQNNPTGGALATDFLGNPRVVNSTIDRGAVEAAPPQPVGPIVTDKTPVKGSTTWLVGEPGATAVTNITFNVSEGVAPGTTKITCQVSSGTILFATDQVQFVGVGQAALPVVVGFDNLSTTVQSGAILCSFARDNVAGVTLATYQFRGGLSGVFENGFETP